MGLHVDVLALAVAESAPRLSCADELQPGFENEFKVSFEVHKIETRMSCDEVV
jgi:hypothetical protein